ncbi:MAG TPA: hypothetical protein VLA44_00925 [Clostridia bacterium]|nr:hypothetical protein [Clostridia bacterium]
MERCELRHVGPQGDEDRLEREQHEQQDARPDEPARHAADKRGDEQEQRQPAERVPELAVGHERGGIVEDAEAGEEDLDHGAGREQPRDERECAAGVRARHCRLLKRSRALRTARR